MLRQLVDATALATNPLQDITVEAQMPGDMYWVLVSNNTNVFFELRDMQGRPYGEVPPYTQIAVRMKPKSSQLIFHEQYRITARTTPVVPRLMVELSPDKNGDSVIIVNA